ncbi:hypothetical protein [Streptomyces sp. NPDC057257]
MLERFPGYTLTTLLQEDTLLLRLMDIEALGTPPQGPAATDWGEEAASGW